MRALFLLLLAANLAFYAWWRYGAPADAADPAPLARQIEPEKLKVIAPGDLRPPAAPKKPAATAGSCLEWGSFTLADAPRAEQALGPLALGARLAQRRTEEVAAWWVFLPAQGSRQAALKKAQELRNMGVDEYFIVQDEGEHHWALSLGVFRNEEAAQARLAALRAQGVRSARVGPRETVVPKIWLQVKSVDAPLQARLKEIARQVEGSELRDCQS
jgi:SPOR domain